MEGTQALMIQGTASGVGKSVLVTFLCRLLSRRGYLITPFKAQNLTSNYYLTSCGKMGKSQAIQAWACGICPHPDMNPLLLTPLPQGTVDVTLGGKHLGRYKWEEYKKYIYPLARKAILSSYERLSSGYEVVIIEGAGSPVEINLSETDLANIFTSRATGAPVFLVADIDRGGAFASLVGTLEIMEPRDRKRVAGLIINKFKGQANQLQAGLDILEKRTGLPVLGVLPYMEGLPIEDEDDLTGSAEPKKYPGLPPRELANRLDKFIPRLESSLNVERLLAIVGSRNAQPGRKGRKNEY